MHVLHIIVGLNIGGAELMLVRLIDGNRQQGTVNHSVISLTDLGAVGDRLRAEGVPVYALNITSIANVFVGLFRLRNLIRQLQPDVVQTWMYHADFLGGLAAAMCGHRRVIWGIRATHIRHGGSRLTVLLRRMCAVLSHWLPQAIVCAAEASRRAHIAVGYDPTRLHVIPNGFEVAPFKSAAEKRAEHRAALSLPAQAIVIGVLGRFNEVKDYRNFVRSAGRVAQASPSVHCLFVGRNLDRSNARLGKWIAEAGIASHCTLLGERTDIPACLSAIDILCISSLSEGFPNVVGEAMAAGVPCVVTDVGDAALLVGDTGFVVPARDSDALAAGLQRMVNLSPQERRAMGMAAQARIEATFSMDASRSKFEQLYRQVASCMQGRA